ncbi:AAA family ATPase [Pseudomonas sp. 13B_2.1_Bac1]|uniref:AAA family ATPase n=1 Tax=Pseudomonas sp. 13B_2.1_Bac1 TaxID=2971624 RepID=UPI0021C5FDF5|nr:AAA family ATPase [Pseudomonas sp. 13B_2.1_Bac1]MCU1785288.1 AAA family ATPase [Pseudomonas sp. 13B_2.1_Bac1]
MSEISTLAVLGKNTGVPDINRPLTPSQAEAFNRIERVMKAATAIGLIAAPGCGKSTVLRHLAEQHGGIVITVANMTEAAGLKPANEFETTIGRMIATHLQNYPLVVVDDLDYFVGPASNASTRPGFVRTVLRQLRMQAQASGRHLLLAGHPPESWETAESQFGADTAVVPLASFGPQDYAVVARAVAGGEAVAGVDFSMLHRFAGHLNGHQLRLAFGMLVGQASITTEDVIESLKSHVMVSNTRVDEVEDISFDQLPGHEHIVEALETNIVFPMEHRDLAARMGLKPKRGVLLFGPPGTGKTSIGRALAHHMRGKFFLIDGSFVSEPPAAFFGKLERVVQEAKENAPSLLFIDDADVLFQIQHIAGLSRYLLSLLDGIESETASGVCVMMTAMDVRPIPEALLRSGRVELWLETRTPDESTREKILRRWLESDTETFEGLDCGALAKLTEGFTPADLRRLVGDGKARLAADIVRKRPLRSADAYFRQAVTEIIAVRNRMASMLGGETLQVPVAQDGYPTNHYEAMDGY